MMENIDFGFICKISATAFAGLFAGGALGINAVTMPGLMKMKDIPSLREQWKSVFLCGKKHQGRIGEISFITGGVACYLDKSDMKYLWLAGTVAMGLVFPWTMVVMYPDINRLLKDDVIKERGEDWVKTKVKNWNVQHFARSVFSTAAFGIFLYGLAKNK